MSTRSESIGKHLVDGIDDLNSSAVGALRSGADNARGAVRAGSRWAAEQESSAVRELRVLKRRLEKQTAQLTKVARKSAAWASDSAYDAAKSGRRYIKKNPWPAVAITAAAGLLVGALLSRRRD
jgi:ElaB/YqjD/DUF883 family membrane-anchored ribosome-binding protein